MIISILGCGWYGKPLALSLIEKGHQVFGSTRDNAKIENLIAAGITGIKLDYPSLPPEEVLNADLIIINIPPFAGQLDWLQSWNWNKNKTIFFITSTSVYGDQQGLLSEEDSPVPNTKNGEILLQEEEWIKSTFTNWNILRFSGLIGPDRHPGKYLSGKKNLANPLWPVNLIHQADAVGFTLALIESNLRNEIFNLASDEHHTRNEFYTDYCRRMNLPLPEFDTSDNSQGKIISNEKSKKLYSYQWPIMIGKDL